VFGSFGNWKIESYLEFGYWNFKIGLNMKSLSLKEIREKVEALEKEIRLQRSILEVIPDPFFILNRKGDFLKVNLKGMEMLGCPPEELQQKDFMEVIPLESVSRVQEGFEAMGQGKEVRFRAQIISRLG
jgi:PAS domain S-box-containing protein